MAQTTAHAEQSGMKNLVEECHAVVQYASSCATECIEHADNPDAQECARICLDAADFAAAVARLAARGSPYVKNAAQGAGEVLAKCAKTCNAMAKHMKDGQNTMGRCADACSIAAESCETIAVVR